MQIIPSEQYPQRDAQALAGFLSLCQQRSAQLGRPVLASITLRVQHIDPLAVLESIYEEGELHFYLENSQVDEAVAGAEAVLSATFSGADRFTRTQEFIATALADAIAIGDMDAPFSGPHFFCAFTFADQQAASKGAADGDFAPATVFVPRWQVSRHAEGYTAVANLLIDPQANLRQQAARVLAAHAKFSRFDYAATAAAGQAPDAAAAKGDSGSDTGGESVAEAQPQRSLCEVGGEGFYVAAVSEALKRISAGKYEKIVLARMLDFSSGEHLHPLVALNRLREAYPSCYAFSFANGRGQSFIGSSPERLLRVQANRLQTEALAGSIARAQSASEDARLGSELLRSDKDLREHALVKEAIVAHLESLGIALDALPPGPRLRRLANLQHLWTPINGELPQGRSLLEVAALLHPTPAVGGVPRRVACADVVALEAAPRGLYTGALGWVDAHGNGEMVVALRSGLINGKHARLYAGAGIVEGSDPLAEQRETGLKFSPLLNSL